MPRRPAKQPPAKQPLPSGAPDAPPVRVVACPTCGREVRWSAEAPFRPFCSERCRLIDLGEWLDERRRIPGDPADGMH